MAIRATFEDRFGVVHDNAYINLFDVTVRKGGSVPANVEAGFTVFAGEEQRLAGKEPVSRVSVSIPADEFVALIGKYVFDKLKDNAEFTGAVDC
jgi:hypothetical protein